MACKNLLCYTNKAQFQGIAHLQPRCPGVNDFPSCWADSLSLTSTNSYVLNFKHEVKQLCLLRLLIRSSVNMGPRATHRITAVPWKLRGTTVCSYSDTLSTSIRGFIWGFHPLLLLLPLYWITRSFEKVNWNNSATILGLQDVNKWRKTKQTSKKNHFLTLLLSLCHCICVSQSGENFLVSWFSDVMSSGARSFHFEQNQQLWEAHSFRFSAHLTHIH